METQARHVVVGLFVLVFAALAAAFAIWLSVGALQDRGDRYLIYFDGPVTGLQEGSQIRYRGIPVGSVREITIDPTDIERVRVLVEVEDGTPFRDDNVARLEIAGLTGGTFIQVVGGTQGAGPPSRPEGESYPVLDSEPSAIARITEDAPQLLERLVDIADRAQIFLSEDNIEAMTTMLQNAEAVSEELVVTTQRIGRAADSVEGAAVGVDGLVHELRVDVARISDDASTVLQTLDEGVRNMEAEIGEASQLAGSVMRSADDTARSVQGLVDATRPGLEDFASTGLQEFTVMTAELRGLARSLSRVAERFERNPTGFLFGSGRSGVPVD